MMDNPKDLRVRRRELKYYISYNEYLVLNNALKRILSLDKYCINEKEGYHVRSIYFDTIDNDMFEEKMGGIEIRSKYRLRSYNTHSKWVKFEIKNKHNDSVIKDTATITRDDAIEIQKKNYDVMLKYKNSVLNKVYLEFKKHSYVPVVLVEYLRKAFVYDANEIRIVFDRFLKSSSLQLDIFNSDPFMVSQLKKDIVIMEIKYNHFIPGWIKKIIQVPSFERSAISKYCIGRLDRFESII